MLVALWLVSRRPVDARIATALERVDERLVGLTERIEAATSRPGKGASGLDAIGSTIDLDEVLHRTLAAAAAVPATDGWSIRVQQPDGTVHAAVSGIEPGAPAPFLFGPPGGTPFTSGFTSWDVKEGDGKRSGLVVPIGREQGGTLAVFSRTANAFDADAAALLAAIARHAAPAIDNAFRYLEVQKLAATDSLTGVGSALAFSEALPREIVTARRYGRPLCLIQIDLDDFGRLNKAPHSHEVGNTALAEFGARLRATIRGSDTAFRNSGGADEFFLILPETTREEASVLYRRLEFEVATPPLAGVDPPVTMSSGLTELRPTDTRESLERRAGAAQSIAKTNGKNQLVADDDPRMPPE